MTIAIYESDVKRAESILDAYYFNLRNQIASAVAAERERCAQVAENLNGWGRKPNHELAQHIAKIIRQG